MSDVLSDEALEDLDRKRQAATPGPWRTMDGYRIGGDLPAINGLSAFVTLADGTRLLQREDGTFILPPESEWPTFFERISEDAEGTMGLKGGCWFLLKPRTEGEEKS